MPATPRYLFAGAGVEMADGKRKPGRPPRKAFEDALPPFLTSVGAGFPLDEAAERAGVPLPTVKTWLPKGREEPESKFGVFARAYEEARASEVEEPMDDAEFKVHLAKSIRKGSTNAMNVYLKMRQLERESDDEAENEQDPLEFADELATRRQRRPEAS